VVDVFHVRYMDFAEVKFYADELAKIIENQKNSGRW